MLSPGEGGGGAWARCAPGVLVEPVPALEVTGLCFHCLMSFVGWGTTSQSACRWFHVHVHMPVGGALPPDALGLEAGLQPT